MTQLSPDLIRLDGRRALVTGAARGIGAATALALARFGADVAVCDRLADGLAATVAAIESLGREAPSAVLDVRDTEAVAAFLSSLTRASTAVGNIAGGSTGGHGWDSLHVLVNNAGGGFHANFEQVSARGEAALIAENFTQVTDLTRRCLPLLRAGAEDAEGGSSIVNITSVEAHRAGPGFAIYSAMKAGVANLTKSLALELATDRIRVNAVAPDMIPTPGDSQLGEDSGAMTATEWALTPWPEEGDPDDVAAVVVWLAGPMSRFVTGSTVHVDGGTFASSGWKRPLGEGPWVL